MTSSRALVLVLLVAHGCSDKRSAGEVKMHTGAWATDGLRQPFMIGGSLVVGTDRSISSSPVIGSPRSTLTATKVVALSLINGSVLWSKDSSPPVAYADDEGVVLYGRTGLALLVDKQGHERWRVHVHDDRSSAGTARGDGDTPFESSVFRRGDRVVIAAGGSLVSVDASGASETFEICSSTRGVVLSAYPSSDGGAYALCGERSGYDDETEEWSGPAGHGERPTYASERSGGETLVYLDRGGAVAWRHSIPMGTNGWGLTASDDAVVYVTPSDDASPAKAVGVLRRNGQVAWTTSVRQGPGDVYFTQQGFLIRGHMIGSSGETIWSADVRMRSDTWVVDGEFGYIAGEREVLEIDLRTGEMVRRIPIDPLQGSVDVVGLAAGMLVLTVATPRRTVVAIPLVKP